MASAKKPKTTQITLDMAIGDALFLKIAKLAHTSNLTFNEQINKIISDAVHAIGDDGSLRQNCGNCTQPCTK